MKTRVPARKIFFSAAFSAVLTLILFLDTAFAERVCVSAISASSRRGPGERYEIVWDKMDKNYPLEVLNKNGNWYYVKDYENDTSWIHKSFVGTWETVITSKDRVNVRSGPGSDQPMVFMVDKGVPFRVLKREGSWLQIQHSDGDAGWIHERMTW
jgi:SH3-like domain-containing protein